MLCATQSCHLCVSLTCHAVMQRAVADTDTPAQQVGSTQQQRLQKESLGGPADVAGPAVMAAAVSDSRQRKALRAYGQKKAKADPAAEGGATLPSDFLALIGGSR